MSTVDEEQEPAVSTATEPRINICRPATFPIRAILRCPTEKRRRRFATLDAAWYGPTWTCCGCGDSFADGERLRRPARRGWREEVKAHAKQVWNQAGRFTRAQHREWLAHELELDVPVERTEDGRDVEQGSA
jgi:hypothetical protein